MNSSVVDIALKALGILWKPFKWHKEYKAYQKSKRQITLEITSGLPPDVPLNFPICLFIWIRNPGNRTVTIDQPTIELPDNIRIMFIKPKSDVQFPCDLREGKKCWICTTTKWLQENIKKKGYKGKIKIRARVENGGGNVYLSKKAKLDLNKEYKMKDFIKKSHDQ